MFVVILITLIDQNILKSDEFLLLISTI